MTNETPNNHRMTLASITAIVLGIVACVFVNTGWSQHDAKPPAKKPAVTTKPAPKSGPDFQPVVVIQLAVADLDRAVKFYTETLGMKLEYRIEQLRWAKVYSPVSGLTFGLGESKNVEGSGTVSVNLAVASADDVRKLLESRGVKFVGETTEIPGVVRLADFVDPDGNRLRLAGPPSRR